MANTIGPRTQIRLETSSFCNLRCPSCSTTIGEVHRQAVGGGFLRFENFRKLLDGHPGLKRIELSNNGEIFLNPALLSMLELAHQRGVKLTADAGVNLNKVRPEVLEGLVKCQFLSLVCSIDGASEETYSIYRVRGKFANVINNIRKINELKQQYRSPFPELTWKFIVFGHNEHELPVAREMARELGMKFRPALNYDPNYSPVRDLEAVRAATGMGAATRDEYEGLYDGELYDESICHQLWDVPQINWDGKLLGCCINIWGDFAERIATEIAPDIDTATEQLAVPIDLRHVPELVANGLVVEFTVVEPFVFIPRGGSHAGRRADSLKIPHGRIIWVIIQCGTEFHAKLTRHLTRHWQFVLVVTEYDKFPSQLWKRGTILLLQLIDFADIVDNVGEFAAHTINRISLFAGAVD